MIRITKGRQRLNSFVRISLLVKFVFTGKLVDEKTNYIILPCRPLITNLQSRFQALGNSGRKRERAHARETRETSPLACFFSRARFFLCPLLPSVCYAGYWESTGQLLAIFPSVHSNSPRSQLGPVSGHAGF